MPRRRFLWLLMGFFLTAAAQTGELPRSAPADEGVNPALLNRCVSRLVTLPDVDVHHMMVMRHGKVIGEWHAAPYEADHLHTLYSASKTITALAMGIAVNDGLLTVDDKVSKFLRDKMPATLSPALDSLTVRHLLMMAAGREQDFSIFEGDADWLTTWFSGTFSGVGKVFNYDSMCTHALAVIISRVTGQRLLDYVRVRLFMPLHITRADWELAPDSVETAGWGLRLDTESQAKLGQLMLQGGSWNGKQLVSPQWIKDMAHMHLGPDKVKKRKLSLWERFVRSLRRAWHTIRSWFTGYNVDDYYKGYGYQTRILHQPLAESIFASGYGGQLIDYIPKLDMVIIINGRANDYGDELNTIYYELLEPLARGDEINGKAEVKPLAIALPQGIGAHQLESRLFKSTISLKDNLLGLKSIEVRRQGDDRIFTMTDNRGPLRAIAACGQWRFTTSDERPIYIMESRDQLVGTQRPFTSIAAYGWKDDTLALRLDWLDGGDNRRMKIAFDSDSVTVFVIDNFDHLLTDTIRGKLEIRHERH